MQNDFSKFARKILIKWQKWWNDDQNSTKINLQMLWKTAIQKTINLGYQILKKR